MKNFKILFIFTALFTLFACQTPKKPQPQQVKKGFLKEEINQAELNNPKEYKKYYYSCRDLEQGGVKQLTTYFPLSRESRRPENFGIYFQLSGEKPVAFDHVINRSLNARGTRFEVVYRSYSPIQGSHVELVARQNGSTYYKTSNGRKAWLSCRER